MTTEQNSSERPVSPEVAAQLEEIKTDVTKQIEEETSIDPNYNRIIEALEKATEQLFEQREQEEGYLFDNEEFVQALDHIVADQLDAVKNQLLPQEQRKKLSAPEFTARFNRWFIFCDAVLNMGFTCLYSRDALTQEDYETVLKTLKLNKQFEAAYLRPRRIRIELAYKSQAVKEKYPWLAMPVLVVKDEKGEEHQIALTPSPFARVWWHDLLSRFHDSYEWVSNTNMEDFDEDNAPATFLEDPRVKWDNE